MTSSLPSALIDQIEAEATWKCATSAIASTLEALPVDLASVLRRINGCVLFNGALHIRGAVEHPNWHSLEFAWRGPHSFSARYSMVEPIDVPFAQDCVGDQFLLRNGIVHLLSAETGELSSVGQSLQSFLANALAHSEESLLTKPLIQLQREGGRLEPGQLINVAPPFCVSHEGSHSLKAVPVCDRLNFLAELASQIRDLPDGSQLVFRPTRPSE